MSAASIFPGSPVSRPFQRSRSSCAIAKACLAVGILMIPGVLSASDAYAKNPARGLAVYKPNLLQSDSTALITEYLSYASHETVTYLLPSNGSRLTIPTRTADLLILPYPGRGELQPEAALVRLSVAEGRFPQYRQLLVPLKNAWLVEAKRSREAIEEEIRQREHTQTIAQRISNLWGSLTKPSPKPAPAVQATPPAESAATELKPNPADLQKNLKRIQDYYETAGKLGTETNQ